MQQRGEPLSQPPQYVRLIQLGPEYGRILPLRPSCVKDEEVSKEQAGLKRTRRCSKNRGWQCLRIQLAVPNVILIVMKPVTDPSSETIIASTSLSTPVESLFLGKMIQLSPVVALDACRLFSSVLAGVQQHSPARQP